MTRLQEIARDYLAVCNALQNALLRNEALDREIEMLKRKHIRQALQRR